MMSGLVLILLAIACGASWPTAASGKGARGAAWATCLVAATARLTGTAAAPAGFFASAFSWLAAGPPQVAAAAAALAVIGTVMWRRDSKARRLGWSSLLGILLCLTTVSGGLVTAAGGADHELHRHRIRKKHLQNCTRHAGRDDTRLATWKPVLLAPDLMRFGTSAHPIDVDAVDFINAVQHNLNVCGPLAEIGVYKGWFVAVMAAIAASRDETVFALDLFAEQHLNVDNSGGGRQHKPHVHYFWRAVRAVNATRRVQTIQANSLELESAQLLRVMRYHPRIFSIDGAHFGMGAFRDLVLASTVLHPKGVIAMDDYLNGGWPGVMQAVATYLAVFPKGLRPFLATPRKLYLCRMSMHNEFLLAAKQRWEGASVCPSQALKAKPDIRVTWDPSAYGSFVDLNADKRKLCSEPV